MNNICYDLDCQSNMKDPEIIAWLESWVDVQSKNNEQSDFQKSEVLTESSSDQKDLESKINTALVWKDTAVLSMDVRIKKALEEIEKKNKEWNLEKWSWLDSNLFWNVMKYGSYALTAYTAYSRTSWLLGWWKKTEKDKEKNINEKKKEAWPENEEIEEAEKKSWWQKLWFVLKWATILWVGYMVAMKAYASSWSIKDAISNLFKSKEEKAKVKPATKEVVDDSRKPHNGINPHNYNAVIDDAVVTDRETNRTGADENDSNSENLDTDKEIVIEPTFIDIAEDQIKLRQDQYEHMWKMTVTLTNQRKELELLKTKYSWSLSKDKMTKATEEIYGFIYGNNTQVWYMSNLENMHNSMKEFETGMDGKTRELSNEQTQFLNDWKNTISMDVMNVADFLAFNINKNLKNPAFSVGLYLKFIDKMLAENPDLTKKHDLELPEPPAMDDVLNDVIKESDESMKNDLETLIETYGKDILLNQPVHIKALPVIRLYNSKMDSKQVEYKVNLKSKLKKIWSVKWEMKDLKQNYNTSPYYKALYNATDIHWLQWIFDWEDATRDKWINMWWWIVCCAAWAAITFFSIWTLSPLGVVMVWAGTWVLAAWAVSQIEQRSYWWWEYATEAVLWAVSWWVFKWFHALRHINKIDDVFDVSTKAAKMILVGEVATQYVTWVWWDVLRWTLTEYEFNLQSSLVHNLWWALFGLSIPAASKVALKLKSIKKSLRAPSEHVMDESMRLLDKVKALRLLNTPSATKKANKLLEKMNKLLWDEKIATMQRLKAEVSAHHSYMDWLRIEKNKLIKLWKSTTEIDAKLQDWINKWAKLAEIEWIMYNWINQRSVWTVLNHLDDEIESIKAWSNTRVEIDENAYVELWKDWKYTLNTLKEDWSGFSTTVFSDRKKLLVVLEERLTANPSTLSKMRLQRLEWLWTDPKQIDKLNGKKITVWEDSYEIKVWRDANNKAIVHLEDSNWKVIDFAKLWLTNAALQNQLVKNISKMHISLSQNIQWIKTPLSKLVPKTKLTAWLSTWLDSKFGKWFQAFIFKDKPTGIQPIDWLRNMSTWDFLQNILAWQKEKSVSNFIGLAMWKWNWLMQAMSLVAISMQVENADSVSGFAQDYLYYRLTWLGWILYDLSPEITWAMAAWKQWIEDIYNEWEIDMDIE